METVDTWLELVQEVGATDLVLTAGAPPLARVDGDLGPLADVPPLSPDDVDALVADLLTPEQERAWRDLVETDFSFDWRGTSRVRGNAFWQRGSAALALRVVPQEIPALDDLGVPLAAQRTAALAQGLVLVTGPTGSGKSTTLASLLDWVNTHRAAHIVTIEDPIEYVHAHKRSAVSQREVGTDTASFASALRSALREDPDVLLVGELRDLESIQFALTLAETGHLVFATLHTNDSSQAVDRLVDVFPAERQAQIRVQLAAVLEAVVHQRLVRRRDGGMVAAYEVLIATPAVRNLVREGKTAQLRNVVGTQQAEGMQTLESDLSRLVAEGVVAHEDALAVTSRPKEVGTPGVTATATAAVPAAAQPVPAGKRWRR